MPLWILYSLFGLCNIAVMWAVTLVFQLGAQNAVIRFCGGMTWAFILLFIGSAHQRYDLRLFKG
jgi:hypothetical protein